MQTRRLGWTGVELPIIGQGTWLMEQDDPRAAISALREGLDVGMTHIDTAELYGSGRVEELVGRAIEGRRDEVFLVSKVLPSNASRAGTLRACERSLRLLRTDRLDLYLLHWPGQYALQETFGAFEELERAGRIRFFGVSNFDATDLDRALAICGEGRIACNQVLYHLGERRIEHEVIPWCVRHDVAVVGYSPFGSGPFVSLSGPAGTVLTKIARARGATPRQVALRFLVREERLFAIPKAGRIDHVAENAAAGELQLSEAEIHELDKAFPRGRSMAGVAML
jgi:diketogulonate reductase-like aldo/keto reductase